MGGGKRGIHLYLVLHELGLDLSLISRFRHETVCIGLHDWPKLPAVMERHSWNVVEAQERHSRSKLTRPWTLVHFLRFLNKRGDLLWISPIEMAQQFSLTSRIKVKASPM